MPTHPYENVFDEDFLDPIDFPTEADATRAPRPLRITLSPWQGRAVFLFLTLMAVLVGGLLLRGHGYKTRMLHRLFPHAVAWMRHPLATAVRPLPNQSSVSPDTFISVDVRLPNSGAVVDAATVNPGSVRLVRSDDGVPVAASANTTAAGDAVVLKPDHPLDLNTTYTFQILPALKDTSGAPFAMFRSRFTTAAAATAGTFPAAFDKISLPQTRGRRYTGVTMGPDHALYACTLEGYILRFPLESDGEVGSVEYVLTPGRLGEFHLITGICFDPASTPGNLILWFTHGQSAVGNADDWTSRIGRLTGSGLENLEDVVIGLPRGVRDHLTNQMAFGPDGAMYVCQASNTAMGAADPGWGMRPERLLNAAILRIDTGAILHPPLDVRTDEGGHYDPFAPGAPVTLYATGLRNAFDLLWHRNGHLYAPINGSSAGGNTPAYVPSRARPRRIDDGRFADAPLSAVPGLEDLRRTEEDVLASVEPGRYYGHPNPARGEYVLDGGNPAPGGGAFTFPQYPVGTQPDRNWRPPIFDFGKHLAPCGLIEYHGGALDGKILVTRYSGGKDIVALTPDADGHITEALTGVDGLSGFSDPLDLTEDIETGCLYVAEHAGKQITMLRPAPHRVSTRVFRQVIPLPVPPTSRPAASASSAH